MSELSEKLKQRRALLGERADSGTLTREKSWERLNDSGRVKQDWQRKVTPTQSSRKRAKWGSLRTADGEDINNTSLLSSEAADTTLNNSVDDDGKDYGDYDDDKSEEEEVKEVTRQKSLEDPRGSKDHVKKLNDYYNPDRWPDCPWLMEKVTIVSAPTSEHADTPNTEVPAIEVATLEIARGSSHQGSSHHILGGALSPQKTPLSTFRGCESQPASCADLSFDEWAKEVDTGVDTAKVDSRKRWWWDISYCCFERDREDYTCEASAGIGMKFVKV